MLDIRVLDCTLRDGGYYNAWDFAPPLVSAYLAAIGAARVDAVEVGFRMLPQGRFLGPFAYSTDEFLRTLPLPKGPALGVMLNAKELLGYRDGPTAATDLLFRDAVASPVQFVRIAVSMNDLEGCEPIAARLKRKGYTVGVNLMQASGASAEQSTAAARTIQRSELIDLVCLADSLGNMTPAMVTAAIHALKEAWDGPIGLHAHNNMGQALSNCQAAIDVGATWIDSTMLGMGRGAGNAQTEYVLLDLRSRGINAYYPEAVFHVVLEEFEQLRSQYGWGPNLLYYLSGKYGIHPTYVQEMLSRRHYELHHIIDAMEILKQHEAAVYADDTLERAMLNTHQLVEGSWSAEGWAKDRDILVIARGASAIRHAEGLCQFIDAKQPVVICLNANKEFPSARVTAYAACHRTRLLMDLDQYRQLQKPLITPVSAAPDPVQEKLAGLTGVELLDYGMRVEPGTFAARPTSCTIPTNLVAAYAMALAEASGASRILLAGFDGYGPGDMRQQEMTGILTCYQNRREALPLLAVTPTTYQVPRGSIYSPGL